MALTDQIDRLVSRLTYLTEQDKVEWQETGNANTYLAPLGDFIITLGRAGSEVYGAYSLQVLGQAAKVIDGVVITFSGTASKANSDWERLRHLHELARRRAMHSDKALSDLLSALDRIA